MNLGEIQAEVLARGFDPGAYSARIVNFINDAQSLIARRVNYYVDEATDAFPTVSGTSSYPWPANFARIRSLSDTDRRLELRNVSIRDLDAAGVAGGAPLFYALVGQNIMLYPTPDGIYDLQLRYWKMPPTLVSSTDVPTLPADYHSLLWVYATWQAYEAEDDPTMGQYWQTRFNNDLSMFTADVKFPDTDGPSQARGMWDQDVPLQGGAWWRTAGGW